VRIAAVRGDITAQHVDAIVNAANSSLLGGAGVDGAIHAAAGPSLLEACHGIRRSALPAGLPTGEAVATQAGRLPARFVIHTVGPIHDEHADGGVELLRQCHRSCLEVADGLGLEGIAFPAISCGAYGWSAAQAAPLAVQAVREFEAKHPDTSITEVRFVLFNDEAFDAFSAAVRSVGQ